jgi:hypothetical protein
MKNKGRLEDQLKISCAEYQDVTIYKNEYAEFHVQHQTYCLPHSPLRKRITAKSEVKRGGLPPDGPTYGFCQFGEQDGSS